MLTPSTSIRPYSKPGRSKGEAGPSATVPISLLRNRGLVTFHCWLLTAAQRRKGSHIKSGTGTSAPATSVPYPVAWWPTPSHLRKDIQHHEETEHGSAAAQ